MLCRQLVETSQSESAAAKNRATQMEEEAARTSKWLKSLQEEIDGAREELQRVKKCAKDSEDKATDAENRLSEATMRIGELEVAGSGHQRELRALEADVEGRIGLEEQRHGNELKSVAHELGVAREELQRVNHENDANKEVVRVMKGEASEQRKCIEGLRLEIEKYSNQNEAAQVKLEQMKAPPLFAHYSLTILRSLFTHRS